MTKLQFDQCTQMAQKGITNHSNLDIFHGFALKSFKQIVCTYKDMAALIQWQTIQLNGNIDTENLNQIFQNRRKFIIVGEPS